VQRRVGIDSRIRKLSQDATTETIYVRQQIRLPRRHVSLGVYGFQVSINRIEGLDGLGWNAETPRWRIDTARSCGILGDWHFQDGVWRAGPTSERVMAAVSVWRQGGRTDFWVVFGYDYAERQVFWSIEDSPDVPVRWSAADSGQHIAIFPDGTIVTLSKASRLYRDHLVLVIEVTGSERQFRWPKAHLRKRQLAPTENRRLIVMKRLGRRHAGMTLQIKQTR
jgi:hypothetical protein